MLGQIDLKILGFDKSKDEIDFYGDGFFHLIKNQ